MCNILLAYLYNLPTSHVGCIGKAGFYEVIL